MLFSLASALALTGCAAAAAGYAAVGLGSAAALTSTCYDRVSLRLIDAASGQTLCDATVRAVDADGSELDFGSCFHAAVPRGEWTVTAERAGYTPATTKLTVPVASHCDPAVQSIDLAIAPVGWVAPAPSVTALEKRLPPAPPAPSTPTVPPAAPPALPSADVPVPAVAPSAVPLAPSSAPTGSFPLPVEPK